MCRNARCDSCCSGCSPNASKPPALAMSLPEQISSLPALSSDSPSKLRKTTSHASVRLPGDSTPRIRRTKRSFRPPRLSSSHPVLRLPASDTPPTSRAAPPIPLRRYIPPAFPPRRFAPQPSLHAILSTPTYFQAQHYLLTTIAYACTTP